VVRGNKFDVDVATGDGDTVCDEINFLAILLPGVEERGAVEEQCEWWWVWQAGEGVGEEAAYVSCA